MMHPLLFISVTNQYLYQLNAITGQRRGKLNRVGFHQRNDIGADVNEAVSCCIMHISCYIQVICNGTGLEVFFNDGFRLIKMNVLF